MTDRVDDLFDGPCVIVTVSVPSDSVRAIDVARGPGGRGEMARRIAYGLIAAGGVAAAEAAALSARSGRGEGSVRMSFRIPHAAHERVEAAATRAGAPAAAVYRGGLIALSGRISDE